MVFQSEVSGYTTENFEHETNRKFVEIRNQWNVLKSGKKCKYEQIETTSQKKKI